LCLKRLAALLSFSESLDLPLWKVKAYLHAHIALKIAALAKLKSLEPQRTARFEPRDKLLAFLDAL